MKRNVLWCTILMILFSCNNKEDKQDNRSSENNLTKTDSVKTKKSTSLDKIVLGEDKEEINGLVKNIYKINGEVFIDIDFVQIKFENVDERVVVNENKKIRTYKVDQETLIY